MDDRTRLALDDLRADSRSGAVELANRAALLLIEYCDRSTLQGEAFQCDLASLCRTLVGAQPSMAPLLNLCTAVLDAAEHPGLVYPGGKPAQATPVQAASNAALRFYTFLAHHPRRIANELLPYVHSGALLLTHSSSATVLAALLRAHDAGKRFGVVCTESRPLYEGVATARRLAAAGIGVEVIADAAAAVFIHGFYTLLIGADAITPEGVINKVGTLGMAVAARSAGVPVYCLAGSEKLVPLGGQISIEEMDPAEILASAQQAPSLPQRSADDRSPSASENPRGFNIYFDLTPLALVTKFFTEDGVLAPAEIEAKLSALVLHPALRREAT